MRRVLVLNGVNLGRLGTREPLVIGLPGDREVDAKRLEAQLAPAEVEPFTDFAGNPALVKGYIGPQVLGAESESKIRYLVDPRVVAGSRTSCSAHTRANSSLSRCSASTNARASGSRPYTARSPAT